MTIPAKNLILIVKAPEKDLTDLAVELFGCLQCLSNKHVVK